MCMVGKIIREGIIASLCGGFFLDPSQGYAISIIHSCLWLLFLILPLVIALIVPHSFIAWCVYTSTITVMISAILYITHRLHTTFDECDPIPQSPEVYEELCNAETHTDIRESRNRADSDLSLDSRCNQISSNIYASVEDIDTQCHRIGLARICTADVLSPVVSTTVDEPIPGPSNPTNLDGKATPLVSNKEGISTPPFLFTSKQPENQCSPTTCNLILRQMSTTSRFPRKYWSHTAVMRLPLTYEEERNLRRISTDTAATITNKNTEKLVSACGFDTIEGLSSTTMETTPLSPGPTPPTRTASRKIVMMRQLSDTTNSFAPNNSHSHNPSQNFLHSSPHLPISTLRHLSSSTGAASPCAAILHGRSSSSLGREHFQRHIEQLRADVNSMPIVVSKRNTTERFIPSLADLDSLPKTSILPRRRHSYNLYNGRHRLIHVYAPQSTTPHRSIKTADDNHQSMIKKPKHPEIEVHQQHHYLSEWKPQETRSLRMQGHTKTIFAFTEPDGLKLQSASALSRFIERREQLRLSGRQRMCLGRPGSLPHWQRERQESKKSAMDAVTKIASLKQDASSSAYQSGDLCTSRYDESNHTRNDSKQCPTNTLLLRTSSFSESENMLLPSTFSADSTNKEDEAVAALVSSSMEPIPSSSTATTNFLAVTARTQSDHLRVYEEIMPLPVVSTVELNDVALVSSFISRSPSSLRQRCSSLVRRKAIYRHKRSEPTLSCPVKRQAQPPDLDRPQESCQSVNNSALHRMPQPVLNKVGEALAIRLSNHRRRRPLRSRFLLPVFPPDLNSLDHAYSSPIRSTMMPRNDTGEAENESDSLPATGLLLDNRRSVLGHTTECIETTTNIGDRAITLEPHRTGNILFSSMELGSSSIAMIASFSQPRRGSTEIKDPNLAECAFSKRFFASADDHLPLRSSHDGDEENQVLLFQSMSSPSIVKLTLERPPTPPPTPPHSSPSATCAPPISSEASTMEGTANNASVSTDFMTDLNVSQRLRQSCSQLSGNGGGGGGGGDTGAGGGGWGEGRQRVRFSRPRRANIVYRVRLFPCIRHRFLIRFDRLQLAALFDKKATFLEMILTILMSCSVSIIGSLLLSSGAFRNFSLICFCFVLAGCHFSLIKSVQPDPASPRHGLNRIIIFSRAGLFCILGGVFIGIIVGMPLLAVAQPRSSSPYLFITLPDQSTSTSQTTHVEDVCGNGFFFSKLSPDSWSNEIRKSQDQLSELHILFYGWSVQFQWLLCATKEFCGFSLLAFPLVFMLGLVPQANTMACYFIEQIDIHAFGASGTVNLVSAVFSLARSLAAIAIGCTLCYLSAQNNNAQDILFSVFWGVHMAICFLLSRAPSNCKIYKLLFHSICLQTITSPRNKKTKSIKQTSKSHLSLLSRISASLRNLFTPKTSTSVTPTSLRQVKPDWECDQVINRCSASDEYQKDGMPISLKLERLDANRLQSSTAKNTSERRSSDIVLLPCHDLDPTSIKSPLPTLLLNEGCEDAGTQRPNSSFPRSTNSVSTKDFNSDGEYLPITSVRRSTILTPPELSFPKYHRRLSSSSGGHRISLNGTSQMSLGESTFLANLGPSFSTQSLSPSIIQTHSDLHDPLPGRIQASMLVRVKNDVVVFIIWAVLGFAVHVSTVFTVPYLQPFLPRVLTWVAILWGFILHYIWPQLRKPYPWLLFSHAACAPLPSGELASFEIAHHWCAWFEKYFLIPAVTVATSTQALPILVAKFGFFWASIILLIASMKMLRNGFVGATSVFLNLFFSDVLFTCDFPGLSETFPVDYFVVSFFLSKVSEMWYKICFIFMYIAPFQTSWGSLFHAVAQLGSIPHFMFILGNCIFSTIISAPLEPFVASVFFITSYARPIRFWEATQKIQRIESTTTSLFSQLRGVSFEQVTANLNAIFYEHLARSLQQRLAGDIALGRWSGGTVRHGDVFILASDELHFLIHIIEVGNGLITFQMRGLEFVGTYCHERESNGLNETHTRDQGFCCCSARCPPDLLSLNTALRLRWLAWQFVHTPYTIEGYQLIDHSAATSLQLIDFRKLVLALFIQCLLYFTVQLPNLVVRLGALSETLTEKFVGENKADLDPVFSKLFDEDFDEHVSGVTRTQFVRVYGEWIRYCLRRSPEIMNVDSSDDSLLMTLCYAISLLSRRCLGGVSGHLNSALETFLHYLHDVFKGDVQVASKDDWVFSDFDLLKLVVTPSMRVALKLYQDHFTWNPLSTSHELYSAIRNTTKTVIICHETDPQWRSAVLNDAEKLFSFRRIDSGTTHQCYRFIMMNKQTLNFQVIKLNSECVRGFWAGQQREQIFLRNNNHERGSIQHAKHVLRNLINSSCDQPIGYPIYVSPLITSFAESHPQYCHIACPSFSIPGAMKGLWRMWNHLKLYCRQTACRYTTELELQPSSRYRPSEGGGFSLMGGLDMPRRSCLRDVPTVYHSGGGSMSSSLYAPPSSDLAPWCADISLSLAAASAAVLPPSSSSVPSTTLSAVVHQSKGDVPDLQSLSYPISDLKPCRVRIIDPTQILNDHLCKLDWPSTKLRANCLPQSACTFVSVGGMNYEGVLVHRWTPSNPDPRARSFCHRSIGLVALSSDVPLLLEGHYAAVWEDLGLELVLPPSLPLAPISDSDLEDTA